LGPEGSGSAFIAQVLSFVVGHCRTFGEWNGYGFNDHIGADNLVIHRSIPYSRPKIFPKSVADPTVIFTGYDETKIHTHLARQVSINFEQDTALWRDVDRSQ
jgi:hypothetical protein